MSVGTPPRVPWRVRLARSARVWRLTLRNAVRYVVHRIRRLGAGEQRRGAQADAVTMSTSADVGRAGGNKKGARKKSAQLMSVVIESLPEPARTSLASLYADAPPMSAELAEGVVTTELGRPPTAVFLDWSPTPTAAASIGQVHRAVTRDGRLVAVKVQYPGAAAAIEADLANAEGMYRLLGSFTLKGVDTRAVVDELRERMRDELDYRIEASNLAEFGHAYADHPFVALPAVVPELSTARVLTTDWVDGLGWDAFRAQAGPEARRRAGESIWRFAQHSIHRLGCFNGDPHPGNYLFSPDGDVTFLDFGMVKRWSRGEWELLAPSMDAIIVDRDPERLVATMEANGFLRAGHGLSPQAVYDYVSAPYRPYLTDRFTFDATFMRDTVATITDLRGPHADVIAACDLPPSFIVLNRVVWGVSALLARLELTAPWRARLLEYRVDAEPATDLGLAEQRWRGRRTDQ